MNVTHTCFVNSNCCFDLVLFVSKAFLKLRTTQPTITKENIKMTPAALDIYSMMVFDNPLCCKLKHDPREENIVSSLYL